MVSSLASEIRKKKPFASVRQEAYLNLARTHSLLETEFIRLLRPLGLSPSTYNVLRILRGHGDTGLPSLEIAAQMVVPTPDITRLIDRLEKSGLAERQRDAGDRRVVHVHITAGGRDILRQLDKPIVDLHESQLTGLTINETKQLNRLLEKARTHRKT